MILASKKAINTLDTQRYSHPIPSREYILKLLTQHRTPIKRHQLAIKLKLLAKKEQEALRRRLRAMERDGQIIFDHRRGYSVINEADFVIGRVIGHCEGFGFLVNDNGGDDLLLNNRDMMQLFDGDRIQARTSNVDHRGRKKAKLIKVLERKTSEVLGELCFEDGDYYVKPENSRITQEIDVDNSALKGAKAGQYVVVTLTDYPCHQYRAFGKVSQVLGNTKAPGIEIKVTINQHGIPNEWSPEIKNAAKSLGGTVADSDRIGRVDLRGLPFVTIDGEDAKDFDDAVCCEKLPKGWRLWVAIADVSHYVRPNDALDIEAQKRGTSVYFPGHAVPMLPEEISNGLCSLNPKVDRLVIACEMTINTSGKMTSYQFSEAVIHSHARLTYNQVNALLTEPSSNLGQSMQKEHSSLVPYLNELYKLYGALSKARSARGSIDFDTQETRFQFNKKRKVEKILPIERNDAHKLIEECMLSTNVATARLLKKLKLPTLYRNHDGPQQNKLSNLRLFLTEKDLKLSGGKKPSPTHYDRVLQHSRNRSDANVIQSMMLRSLSQAEYSTVNQGHFGLAYSEYAHFTSPIRRYPDLLVHRAIRSVIQQKESGSAIRRTLKSISKLGGDPVKRLKNVELQDPAISYPYDTAKMKELANHCSLLSRRADKASWDVDKWLKCEYMLESIGKPFTGTITTVTRFGLFVELNDTKIEGLIPINSLKKDYYHFDNIKKELKGQQSRAAYSIGDKVYIRVSRVDMDTKKIEFVLKNNIKD